MSVAPSQPALTDAPASGGDGVRDGARARDQGRVRPSGVVATLRAAWRYRHPSLVPVLVLWLLIGLGLADFARAWSPTARGLLGSNDWLINYEGGFVRRGLAGQLLYWFHQAFSSTSLTEDLLVMQMGLYVAVGAVVSVLAMRRRNRLLPWVLLSPAALLFTSYSVLGGFRKDLLLFLALAVIALARDARTPRGRVAACVVGGALYLLFVWSWEAGILFLPVVLVFLRTATRPLAARWFPFLAGAVSVTGIVAFVLQAANPGSNQVVAGICTSLARAGIPYRVNCRPDGNGILGLAWLQFSWHHTFREVQGYWPGYGFYVVWLAIGLAPFVVSRWVPRHRLLTALAVAGTLPLYVVGSDYGRWVRLAVTCVTLYWLMTAEDQEEASAPRGALELVALFVWVTCWSVPYWRDAFLVGGFFNAVGLSGLLGWFHQYR